MLVLALPILDTAPVTSIRLRGGRSDAAKADATAMIFAAADAYCAEVMATSSFMLSMEMRDIDPALSPKASWVRKYLPGATE